LTDKKDAMTEPDLHQTLPVSPPQSSDSLSSPLGSPAKSTGMVQAASLIAAGNVISRVLGMGREMVIAYLFGATGQVSAFRVAQIIPTMLYDLLIGGMVSSALVPVFSEQAERDRSILWHLVSLVLTVAVIVMVVVVLIMELVMPHVALWMAVGFDNDLLALTTRLMRITTPPRRYCSSVCRAFSRGCFMPSSGLRCRPLPLLFLTPLS